jgi:hypothetical protein
MLILCDLCVLPAVLCVGACIICYVCACMHTKNLGYLLQHDPRTRPKSKLTSTGYLSQCHVKKGLLLISRNNIVKIHAELYPILLLLLKHTKRKRTHFFWLCPKQTDQYFFFALPRLEFEYSFGCAVVDPTNPGSIFCFPPNYNVTSNVAMPIHSQCKFCRIILLLERGYIICVCELHDGDFSLCMRTICLWFTWTNAGALRATCVLFSFTPPSEL